MSRPDPTYRRHRKAAAYRQKHPDAKDLAFVEMEGRRFYLGEYDSAASWEACYRLLAERRAGQPLPAAEGDTARPAAVHQRDAFQVLGVRRGVPRRQEQALSPRGPRP